MKYLFLSVLILGSACGRKEPAPPLKQSQQRSELRVSPAGVSGIQKLFNVYSATGKLSLQEIKNIAHRISPKLAAYIDGLDLQIDPAKKYNAAEFFTLLGESNRTLLWALAYDLQTEAGWKKVLSEEFAWSDEGLSDETLRRLNDVLAVIKTPEGQEKFLSLALKIGGAFNVMENFEPSPGSVIDAVTKHTIYAYTKEPLPELTPETLRLVKFNFVIQYALADLNPLPEDATPLDRFAQWSVDGMGTVILTNYPALKQELLLALYKSNVKIARKKAESDAENAHKVLHADAYATLGKATETTGPESWSAYDAFALVKATCKKNVLPGKFEDWVKYFDEKVAGHSYTDPAFCETIKDTSLRSPAPESRLPAGRRSSRASRGR